MRPWMPPSRPPPALSLAHACLCLHPIQSGPPILPHLTAPPGPAVLTAFAITFYLLLFKKNYFLITQLPPPCHLWGNISSP